MSGSEAIGARVQELLGADVKNVRRLSAGVSARGCGLGSRTGRGGFRLCRWRR